MPPRRSLSAFTLLELLVVVTVIVVLLALLVPALDKAIYVAELTVCGANLRTIGTGAINYAVDHRRYYPGRSDDEGAVTDAIQIKNQAWDIPGLMSAYVSLDTFLDPLNGGISLDAASNEERSTLRPETIFMPGYHIYFQWENRDLNIVAMKRMGQRMVFTEPHSGEERRFRLMAVDHDVRVPGQWCHTSHPDDGGYESHWLLQNQPNPWFYGVDAVAARVTVAWWQNFDAPGRRGAVDNNFGMDDGSVQRLTRVPIVEGDDDSRITFLPDRLDIGEYNTGRMAQVPRSN